MWALFQRQATTPADFAKLFLDSNPLVRAHAARAAGELKSLEESTQNQLVQALFDHEPQVVRSAAEAIAKHPRVEDVMRLLDRLATLPADDVFAKQAVRIATRDVLANETVAGAIDGTKLATRSVHADEFSSIVLGLHTPQAGEWMLTRLQQSNKPLQSQLSIVKHVATEIDEGSLPRLIGWSRQAANGWDQERVVLEQIHTARGSRLGSAAPLVNAWATDLATQWQQRFQQHLEKLSQATVNWTSEAGAGWATERRSAEDGNKDAMYRSSLQLGERYTGTMSTGSFIAPAAFSFWIVGHNGLPESPDSQLNYVRLVADESGEAIATAYPPRSDTAKQIQWDLSAHAGKRVHLECIDRNSGPPLHGWQRDALTSHHYKAMKLDNC